MIRSFVAVRSSFVPKFRSKVSFKSSNVRSFVPKFRSFVRSKVQSSFVPKFVRSSQSSFVRSLKLRSSQSVAIRSLQCVLCSSPFVVVRLSLCCRSLGIWPFESHRRLSSSPLFAETDFCDSERPCVATCAVRRAIQPPEVKYAANRPSKLKKLVSVTEICLCNHNVKLPAWPRHGRGIATMPSEYPARFGRSAVHVVLLLLKSALAVGGFQAARRNLTYLSGPPTSNPPPAKKKSTYRADKLWVWAYIVMNLVDIAKTVAANGTTSEHIHHVATAFGYTLDALFGSARTMALARISLVGEVRHRYI